PEPAVDEREVPRRPAAVRAAADRVADEADETSPAFAEELALGLDVLKTLLEKMGVDAQVTLDDRPGMEGLEVEGGDLGALIGRGGENLVALQQIVSAITSKSVGRTVHVPVDVEGYRRRREEQLREIARRIASRVKASGQAVTLEPMLAYERRIVHLAVQEQPGIKTESVGMDPNRRVVISSTAAGARGPVGFRPQGGGGFLPVVIRRMGGSTEDVALVVAGPFVGHLLSPVFGYLLARFRPVRITAFTSTLSRSIFLVGVLLAATPFALAFVSVLTWVIAVA